MIIGKKLVNLYKSFASNDSAFYGNISIEMIKEFIECLEISSVDNFSIQKKDEEFGQVMFWSSLNIND